MTLYKGGCHCGAVRYEAEAELDSIIECNCSHCEKKGFLLKFIPTSAFKLLSGEDNLTEYRFYKKRIAHLFCKTCGVQSFGRGTGKDGTPRIALNVRCLDGVDITTLPITKFNGREMM